MKSLNVPLLPRTLAPEEIYKALESVEPQPIACDTWHPTDNVPEVSVRLAHDGGAFLVRYDVREKEVRAAARKDGDHSWEDSCVEFFIAPEGDDFYYNFEFSCAGFLYLQGGRKGDRVSPPAEIPASVIRASSAADGAVVSAELRSLRSLRPLPLLSSSSLRDNSLSTGPSPCPCPGVDMSAETTAPPAACFEEPYRWSMVARIPVTALWRHGFKSTRELTAARGNFYKCGDLLPHPHFLSWAPIDLPEPAFHCPQFFGKLVIE